VFECDFEYAVSLSLSFRPFFTRPSYGVKLVLKYKQGKRMHIASIA
jgi:hypothetical protein